MFNCIDCLIESEGNKDWYVDFGKGDKVYRCNSCGKKENDKRWKQFHGDKEQSEFEMIHKQDRIQYCKNLREANLSPWTYRKMQTDNKAEIHDNNK